MLQESIDEGVFGNTNCDTDEYHECPDCGHSVDCELAETMGSKDLDVVAARVLLDMLEQIEAGAAPPPPVANDEPPAVPIEHVTRERDEWRARALDLEEKNQILARCLRASDDANKKAIEEIERTKELLRRIGAV
jgi:hypothetical protein